MPENHTRLTDLLTRYANNSLLQDEENELFGLLNDTPATEIEPLLMPILERTEPVYDEGRKQRILSNVFGDERKILVQDDEPVPVRKMFSWRKWAVAASIILALGVGGYLLFFNKDGKQPEIVVKEQKHDVEAPKVARATLRLDDGTIVYLDSAKNGSLALQGNMNVVKLADGQIAYQSSNGNVQSTIQYNYVTNPRGSIIQSLTLSDGTKVWLNSESSMKYPVAFIGNERKVEITGEAYFEVTKDASKKFIVEANGVSTEVLGTHFNVNSYTEEASIKVTLLEGSVIVRRETSNVKIKPGQQAVVNASTPLSMTTNNNVDVEQVMAWKSGKFSFNRADIKTVMRELARWYDLDVEYAGPQTKDLFGGDMQRDLPLSNVLDFLKKSQVHFEVEGKKVIVKP